MIDILWIAGITSFVCVFVINKRMKKRQRQWNDLVEFLRYMK